MIKNPPAGAVKNTGSIPGLEKSPREEHGNPLQYSCLENSKDEEGRLQFIGWQTVTHD